LSKRPSKGNWTVKKEKVGKLPPLHIMGGELGDLYLCSVHETHNQGEDQANANLFAASKDMYEAITIGLTGADLDGKPVEQSTAMDKLKSAKAKAEGVKVVSGNTKTTKS
jgi:hypothetical protein